MIQAFAVIASLLVFFALWMLLPPLIRGRREQPSVELEAYRAALRELRQRYQDGELGGKGYAAAREKLALDLLMDIERAETTTVQPPMRARWIAGMVAVIVPALAIGLYLRIGSPVMLQGVGAPGAAGTQGQGGAPSLESMVAALEQKLKAEPDNIEGWYMLARSYMSLQQYDKGAAAMEKVYAAASDQPDVVLQYADALTMAAGGKVTDQAFALVEKALSLDANHAEALWLAGIGAEQRGQVDKAIGYWERALILVADNPESVALLKQAIERARGQASASAPAARRASLDVRVSLAPELADKVAPEDTVFVFARAANGPPMPLAAQKLRVAELPKTVTLDDSQAMMPERTLSSAAEVVVGARISKSNSPTPQPGDLEGLSAPLSPTTVSAVDVAIDRVR